MKNSLRAAVGFALIIMLGVAVWLTLSSSQNPTQELDASATDRSTLPHTHQAAPDLESGARHASAEAPLLPTPEQSVIEGTDRMYAAHAPLREPEVADPDSNTNKQILETMVLKALARQAAESSPNPAGN